MQRYKVLSHGDGEHRIVGKAALRLEKWKNLRRDTAGPRSIRRADDVASNGAIMGARPLRRTPAEM
jgi:hypothetical protein